MNLFTRNSMEVQAVHSAVAHHDIITAIQRAKLLMEKGALVNSAQRGGWILLYEAAFHSETKLARLLRRYGADKSAKSVDGRSPVDIARRENHADVMALYGGQ